MMDRISEAALIGLAVLAFYAMCGVAFGIFGGITYVVGRWFVNLVA